MSQDVENLHILWGKFCRISNYITRIVKSKTLEKKIIFLTVNRAFKDLEVDFKKLKAENTLQTSVKDIEAKLKDLKIFVENYSIDQPEINKTEDQLKTTLEKSGEDVKTTLETGREDGKTTLEEREKDIDKNNVEIDSSNFQNFNQPHLPERNLDFQKVNENKTTRTKLFSAGSLKTQKTTKNTLESSEEDGIYEITKSVKNVAQRLHNRISDDNKILQTTKKLQDSNLENLKKQNDFGKQINSQSNLSFCSLIFVFFTSVVLFFTIISWILSGISVSLVFSLIPLLFTIFVASFVFGFFKYFGKIGFYRLKRLLQLSGTSRALKTS